MYLMIFLLPPFNRRPWWTYTATICCKRLAVWTLWDGRSAGPIELLVKIYSPTFLCHKEKETSRGWCWIGSSASLASNGLFVFLSGYLSHYAELQTMHYQGKRHELSNPFRVALVIDYICFGALIPAKILSIFCLKCLHLLIFKMGLLPH